MLHRPIEAQLPTARYMVYPPRGSMSMRGLIASIFTVTRRVISLLGIIALLLLSILFFKPEFAEHVAAVSPFSETSAQNTSALLDPLNGKQAQTNKTETSTASNTNTNANTHIAMENITKPSAMTVEDRKNLGTFEQQKRVTEWLSRRYRVANTATNMLVSAAYLSAQEIKIDPLLILAVMAIESRFNPFAESPMGAQGLMQVMSKLHHDKFQALGSQSALNPAANIAVGARILKEYISRGGSVEAGLKAYVGAAEMASDGGYGRKVLAEYNNLKRIAFSKNISTYTTSTKARTTPSVEIDAKNTEDMMPAVGKKDSTPDQIAAL